MLVLPLPLQLLLLLLLPLVLPQRLLVMLLCCPRCCCCCCCGAKFLVCALNMRASQRFSNERCRSNRERQFRCLRPRAQYFRKRLGRSQCNNTIRPRTNKCSYGTVPSATGAHADPTIPTVRGESRVMRCLGGPNSRPHKNDKASLVTNMSASTRQAAHTLYRQEHCNACPKTRQPRCQ